MDRRRPQRPRSDSGDAGDNFETKSDDPGNTHENNSDNLNVSPSSNQLSSGSYEPSDSAQTNEGCSSENSSEQVDSEDSGKDVHDCFIALLLKLQQKLKAVEAEKSRLAKKLENYEAKADESPKEKKLIKDAIRLQDLEMENSKLKNEVARLRESLAKEDPSNKAQDQLNQFVAMQEELERYREERIQMKTILADRNLPVNPASYSSQTELINEDGELLMAYETQKTLIRQLEAEIQSEKSNAKKTEQELRHELQKLQEENERQQKLLSQEIPEGGEIPTGEIPPIIPAIPRVQTPAPKPKKSRKRKKDDDGQPKESKLKKPRKKPKEGEAAKTPPKEEGNAELPADENVNIVPGTENEDEASIESGVSPEKYAKEKKTKSKSPKAKDETPKEAKKSTPKKTLPKVALKFTSKKKKKKALQISDHSDIGKTPPSSPVEADGVTTRRSARNAARKKYTDDIELHFSDDETIEMDFNQNKDGKLVQTVAANESKETLDEDRSEENSAHDDVPPGWKKIVKLRKKKKTAGKSDIYIQSPRGTTLRSKPDLEKYLLTNHPNLTIQQFNCSKSNLKNEMEKK